MRSASIFCLAMMLTAMAGTSRADPVISLPLQGYERLGKFFPIRVQSDSPVDVTVQIEDGVGAHGVGTNLILPAMTLNEACRSVHVIVNGHATDLPITPVRSTLRIGLFAAGTAAKHDSETIVIPLPADQPFPLSQAYESADEVWPTAAGPLKIDTPRGPTTSLDDQMPYDAMSGFVAGRSIVVRRTVWLGMAIFAIAALGLSLLRNRRAWIGVAVLGAVWTAAGAAYISRQSPVSQQQGLIFIPQGNDHYQIDSWLFRTSLQPCEDVVDAGASQCRPIFGGQAKLANMWIDVRDTGWQFHYHLAAGGKMAFLGRTWARIVGLPFSSRTQGALQDIAREDYARPGETVRAVDFLHGGESWLIAPAR